MQQLPVSPEGETTQLYAVIMFSTVSLNAQKQDICDVWHIASKS